MGTRQRLIIGDMAEYQENGNRTGMANAALLEFDMGHNCLSITTSTVGLPPIFIYQDFEKIVIASDIHLLTTINGINLHFSPHSILDMCRTGHPAYGRTLFREVAILSPDSSFIWSPEKGLTQQCLGCTETRKESGVDSYIEALAGSFKRAMSSIDVSRSFLSLTGGLDTRTILALLVTNKTSIPSYTITGTRHTIDARISSSLCKVYGIPHELVLLDDTFLKDLPNYAMEASLLSGGLSSVDEAHEVYFYSCISKDLESRLNGNLGNQLGRYGVEKVSKRNTSTKVLNQEFLACRHEQYANSYRGTILEYGTARNPVFLGEHDFLPASIANYCIGSNYAVQQSPYANRAFIEHVLRGSTPNPLKSATSLRLRDLRHRFIGHSAKNSFQVRIINETGGYVSTCPINWGWRANGRFSLSGSAEGCLAFLDAALARYFPSIMAKKGPTAFGVTGMHNYKYPEYWLKYHLKDFIHDILSSSRVRNGGLFNRSYLTKALKAHFSGGQDYTKEIQLSLDLALAQKLFNGGI